MEAYCRNMPEVVVGGVRIAYRRRGTGPPLVLFHVPNVVGIPVPADVDTRIETFAHRYRDLLAAPAPPASGAHA